jgi:flagellar motility protein MotE (MotC chaperone)
MMGYIRDLRLIPIALIASACLLALKVADLALHASDVMGGDNAVSADADSVIHSMPDGTTSSGGVLSWATQMFNFPGGNGAAPAEETSSIRPQLTPLSQLPKITAADSADITGSVTTPAPGDAKTTPGAANPSDTASAAAPGKSTAPPPGAVVPTDGTTMPTGAERAILERLQERREELDIRARELDIRESLIQGAEKRMDAKLAEIKEVESRIKVETGQKDDAEAARLKGLVSMYENMKARDAAKIFNGLDTNVLIEVSAQINPRQMADILAQMAPEAAEKLTVELATKAQQTQASDPAGLPKIEGRPTAP